MERDLTKANIELSVLRPMLTPPTDDELEDWINQGQSQIDYLDSVPVDAPCHPPWIVIDPMQGFCKDISKTKILKIICVKRRTKNAVFYLTHEDTFHGATGTWVPRKVIKAEKDKEVIIAADFKIREVTWND